MSTGSTETRSDTPPSPDLAIRCQVVTPERIVLDEWVRQVVVPLPDGEFGIAKNHDPVIARLGYGSLRLKLATLDKNYFLDGGFLQIRDNHVVILTNRAQEATGLRAEEIEKDLASARSRPASDDVSIEARLTEIDKLRTRLRMAKRTK
ncbi:ATP synthase F1 subunit epsilon [bacterium]|nr:ATP synthase F1 subunit epsilon [bacterium]